MLKTDMKNLNERLGFNHYNSMFSTELKGANEESSFLIEQKNLNQNKCKEKFSNNNCMFSSFELDNNYLSKTQSNFNNKYSYYKTRQYLQRYFKNKDEV